MTDDTMPNDDGYTVLVGKGGVVMALGGMPETLATGLLATMADSPQRPPGTLLDCCRDADALDRGCALAERTAADRTDADGDGADGATPLARLADLATGVVGDAAASLARRLGR